MNLKSLFRGGKGFPVIYPFAQYEYYNPQEKGEGMDVMDARCQVSKWNFGRGEGRLYHPSDRHQQGVWQGYVQ